MGCKTASPPVNFGIFRLMGSTNEQQFLGLWFMRGHIYYDHVPFWTRKNCGETKCCSDQSSVSGMTCGR